ncbi:hypothetical protein BBK14_23055 [Parafrankia soli]|uniref:Uncharacterized protein n=1 Tax=Parafrankia soli TaxID=2599596 RepID=A0A1S1PV31_9ACTN|nr:hypothetical protein BBK14_23055 [Parafrankia soli]
MPEGADTLTGQNAGQDIVGNRITSQCQDAGTRRQSGVRAAVKRGPQLHRHGHRRVGPQADAPLLLGDAEAGHTELREGAPPLAPVSRRHRRGSW